MKVFRDLSELPAFENTVVTIGSFDGLHKGHQKILNRLKKISRDNKVEHVVITFHPHPRSIIYPKDKSLVLLTSLEEKIQLLESMGIQNLVIVPFSVEFSQLSAEEYIANFIHKYFKPKTIVIGYDHKFGLNRSGDINLLNLKAPDYGFEVVEIPKQEIEEITISSTKIRAAIKEGHLEHANVLLGHPYPLAGHVIRGRKLGTEIGFPTANLDLENAGKLIPKDGIYACYVHHGKKRYEGMLYIGDIPTIGTDRDKAIEVNIFDFDKDIYSERITVEVLRFLREDQKFDSIEALKAQLHEDRKSSLAYFDSLKKKVKAKATIAILNYNTRDYLEMFLPGVAFSSTLETDILVIDNASTDDSVEYTREWFPEVNITELDKNYGFAEGYNQGLKKVNTPYTILLNSDVEVTENWLDPLIEFLDNNEDVAAVMPKIRAQQDKSSFEYAGASGGYMDALGFPYCRGRIFDTVEKDEGQYDTAQQVFWATGAAMVIRTDVFKKLGGFDPSYFAHQEEIDLCWRINNAGLKIFCIPESVVYHVGGGTLNYSNPRKTYLNFRNSFSNLVKNEKAGKLIYKLPLRWILDLTASFKFLLSGNLKDTFAVWKALISGLIKLPTNISKRFFYQSKVKALNGQSHQAQANLHSIIWSYYVKGKKKFGDL